ncbi:cytochrome P450 [Streptomyces sp. NPDC002928]|uniref:cytochrome P450 n=1 Tax=Streptomyces sp. NPDC002928 TaxID=3154440 RepID=UPI0033B85C8B
MPVTASPTPTATELLAHPGWYRQLPADQDVHLLADGVYAVTGNATVQEAMNRPELAADHPLKASSRALGPNVLDSDGPGHRAFRALLAPILAARQVERWRDELMPGLIDALVDAVVGTTTDDFYGTYAHRLPYGIVTAIMGVDRSLEGEFHTLTRPLANLLDHPTVETEAARESLPRFLELIEEQRSAGGLAPDSLLATIERTRDRKAISLTDSEVRATALLFFLAGTETSSAFITSLVYCLGNHQGDLAELLDATAREQFIEEVLRLYPPVQTIARFAQEDLALGGVDVPRHSAVLVSLAAANRDPRIFPDPETFRPGRPVRSSLPFSAGPHACPGALLAKAEFMLLLERLVRRCARITVTDDRHGLVSQSFTRPADFTATFIARTS